MLAKRILICATAVAVILGIFAAGRVDADKKKDKKVEKKKEVWTDADHPSLPADFKFQGEYVRPNVGCQVIALGNGHFQAVLCKGGLPGAGWDGKNKHLMEGKLE